MGIIKKVVERRKQFLAKHKKEATLFANKIARILGEKFKAEKVIFYGSLVREDYFDYNSDIDLAVKGLGNNFFSAYGYCLGLGEFDIDIRNYDSMPEEFKERVDREGIILYERETNS